MNVPELVLDDLTWADLVEQARRAIPAASEGQWTLHAPIDPGVTLLELFAAELEERLFVLDRVPDTLVRAVMRLLLDRAAGLRPAQAAVAVLSIASRAGPVSLGAGSELRQVADNRVVLTTEHTVLAAPAAAVTGFEVAGTDVWSRLRGGEPVDVFGADGRSDAVLQITASTRVAEHRLYLAVKEPTVAIGWQPGTEPPARLPSVEAVPQGLGWIADDGRPIFLDQEGQQLASDGLGALELPADHAPRWEALVGGERWALRVEDGTAGLRVSGVIRLRPPPDRMFPATVRVRVSKPSPDTPIYPSISAVSPNAVVARHRRLVSHEDLTTEPLLPLPGREFPLGDAAPNATQPFDRVLDGAGLTSLTVRHADGAEETWPSVDDLAFCGPTERCLQADRNRGVLRFGDGRAAAFRAGIEARACERRIGSAPASPAIGLGVDFAAEENVTGSTVTRLVWGQEPESAEEARARAAQQLTRSTRGVGASDIEAIARAVPGISVARVHVEPGLDPDHAGVAVPDAVTIFCVPAIHRRGPDHLQAIPAPELDDWSRTALTAALRHARLVGSLLTVQGPAYRAIELAVELDVLAGDSAAVLRRAELTLRHYLDPLIGGSRATGWPFGAPVHPADLSAALQRVLGRQAEVSAVRVAEAGSGTWTDCDPLLLRRYDLPLFRAVTLIRSGPPRR